MRNCLAVGSRKFGRGGKRMTLVGKKTVDDMKAVDKTVDKKTEDTRAGTDAGKIELDTMDFCRLHSSELLMTGKGCIVNCSLSCNLGTASSSRSVEERISIDYYLAQSSRPIHFDKTHSFRQIKCVKNV